MYLPVDSSQKTRLEFLTARFGVRKKGKTFYLYQHEAIHFPGSPKRMRLLTSTGQVIYKDQQVLPGEAPLMRMRSNQSKDWIISNQQ